MLTRATAAPRKSLPLSFPDLTAASNAHSPVITRQSDRRAGKRVAAPSPFSSSEDDEPEYGRMSTSSSEDSILGTPTRPKGRGEHVPEEVGKHCSVSGLGFEWLSPGSPPLPKFNVSGQPAGFRTSMSGEGSGDQRASLYDEPGKFERDFVVVEDVGHGEFGTVIMAKHKNSSADTVFAIKCSKKFEGVKHRCVVRPFDGADPCQAVADSDGPVAGCGFARRRTS